MSEFRSPAVNLAGFIDDKFEWSKRAFGLDITTAGIVSHIRKELAEIESDPNDLIEYVDVIFLALDGACRAGYSGREIVEAFAAKHAINLKREWKKTVDGHSEHIKSGEET
jgi:hypothetical protein